MEKDAGVLTLEGGHLLFRFLGDDDHIRVAETAQLPDHRDPALESMLGHPVTILWTKVREADGSPRLMAHRLALHRDIRQRAFEISASPASGTPVENWLRAEDELLGTAAVETT